VQVEMTAGCQFQQDQVARVTGSIVIGVRRGRWPAADAARGSDAGDGGLSIEAVRGHVGGDALLAQPYAQGSRASPACSFSNDFIASWIRSLITKGVVRTAQCAVEQLKVIERHQVHAGSDSCSSTTATLADRMRQESQFSDWISRQSVVT
jgi:hypothetical protein